MGWKGKDCALEHTRANILKTEVINVALGGQGSDMTVSHTSMVSNGERVWWSLPLMRLLLGATVAQ